MFLYYVCVPIFLYALFFPTMVSELWFNFVGERELDPVLDPVIGCEGLTLVGENVRCKCEWLKSHMTSLPNILRFWTEMWCLSLSLSWSWSIGLISAPDSLGLPNILMKMVMIAGDLVQ